MKFATRITSSFQEVVNDPSVSEDTKILLARNFVASNGAEIVSHEPLVKWLRQDLSRVKKVMQNYTDNGNINFLFFEFKAHLEILKEFLNSVPSSTVSPILEFGDNYYYLAKAYPEFLREFKDEEVNKSLFLRAMHELRYDLHPHLKPRLDWFDNEDLLGFLLKASRNTLEFLIRNSEDKKLAAWALFVLSNNGIGYDFKIILDAMDLGLFEELAGISVHDINAEESVHEQIKLYLKGNTIPNFTSKVEVAKRLGLTGLLPETDFEVDDIGFKHVSAETLNEIDVEILKEHPRMLQWGVKTGTLSLSTGSYVLARIDAQDTHGELSRRYTLSVEAMFSDGLETFRKYRPKNVRHSVTSLDREILKQVLLLDEPTEDIIDYIETSGLIKVFTPHGNPNALLPVTATGEKAAKFFSQIKNLDRFTLSRFTVSEKSLPFMPVQLADNFDSGESLTVFNWAFAQVVGSVQALEVFTSLHDTFTGSYQELVDIALNV